jgi:hypothetical protein
MTLPIRAGEHIFVWFARYRSAEAFEGWRARLAQNKN